MVVEIVVRRFPKELRSNLMITLSGGDKVMQQVRPGAPAFDRGVVTTIHQGDCLVRR